MGTSGMLPNIAVIWSGMKTHTSLEKCNISWEPSTEIIAIAVTILGPAGIGWPNLTPKEPQPMFKFVAARYRQWQYARYVAECLKAQKALTQRIEFQLAFWVNEVCPKLQPRVRGHCWPNSPRLAPRYVVGQLIQQTSPETILCLANAPQTQVKQVVMAEIAAICYSEYQESQTNA